jgi:hypothetical protein
METKKKTKTKLTNKQIKSITTLAKKVEESQSIKESDLIAIRKLIGTLIEELARFDSVVSIAIASNKYKEASTHICWDNRFRH